MKTQILTSLSVLAAAALLAVAASRSESVLFSLPVVGLLIVMLADYGRTHRPLRPAGGAVIPFEAACTRAELQEAA